MDKNAWPEGVVENPEPAPTPVAAPVSLTREAELNRLRNMTLDDILSSLPDPTLNHALAYNNHMTIEERDNIKEHIKDCYLRMLRSVILGNKPTGSVNMTDEELEKSLIRAGIAKDVQQAQEIFPKFVRGTTRFHVPGFLGLFLDMHQLEFKPTFNAENQRTGYRAIFDNYRYADYDY